MFQEISLCGGTWKEKKISLIHKKGAQIKSPKKREREAQVGKEHEEETHNIKSNSKIELKQRGIQTSWKSCQFTNEDRQ